jgi:hypothetical protein
MIPFNIQKRNIPNCQRAIKFLRIKKNKLLLNSTLPYGSFELSKDIIKINRLIASFTYHLHDMQNKKLKN